MAAPIPSPAKCEVRSVVRFHSEVSKTTTHEAVTEKLGYRKLCAHWVPKILLDDHKKETDGFCAEVLDHPPYSPDLAPSDFHWFLQLKKHLAGKKIDDDDEVQDVTTWFKGMTRGYRS
jgi:hypothetical protein